MSVGTGRGEVTEETRLRIMRGSEMKPSRKAKWHAGVYGAERTLCGRLVRDFTGATDYGEANYFLGKYEDWCACPSCARVLMRRLREQHERREVRR